MTRPERNCITGIRVMLKSAWIFLENWKVSSKLMGSTQLAWKYFQIPWMKCARLKVSTRDLGIFDYHQEKQKMVAKLPLYIENKWRTVILIYHIDERHFLHSRCLPSLLLKGQGRPTSQHLIAKVGRQHHTSKTIPSTRKPVLPYSQSLNIGFLNPGHRSKFCKNRLRCTNCDKRHPTEHPRDDFPRVAIEKSPKRLIDL